MIHKIHIKAITNPFPTSHDTAVMLEEIRQANPHLNASNPRLSGVRAVKKQELKEEMGTRMQENRELNI